MARTIQGKLDARGSRFAIVISRFNSLISERLLSGALDALERHGASPDDITVVWVQGVSRYRQSQRSWRCRRIRCGMPRGADSGRDTTFRSSLLRSNEGAWTNRTRGGHPGYQGVRRAILWNRQWIVRDSRPEIRDLMLPWLQ